MFYILDNKDIQLILIDDIGEKVYFVNFDDEYELMMRAYFMIKRNFDVKSNILISKAKK